MTNYQMMFELMETRIMFLKEENEYLRATLTDLIGE